MTTDTRYTTCTAADEVTPEILEVAETTDEWYSDQPIEWEDFIDRMDGTILRDGTVLDMGPTIDSPAIRKIKRHIRDLRRTQP